MTATVCSVDIDRPQDQVFTYVTDPTHFHEWQAGVVAGGMEGGAPTVGSTCRTTRLIGGKERASTSTVTKCSPPDTWAVHGIDGPIRALVDVTVHRVSDHGSKVTIAVDFEGHGIGRVLVPLLVRRQARREMPANVERLKQRLEATAPAT